MTKPKAASSARSARGAKRGRVLAVAAQALNSRGISQTSLADIAQQVGVSRAALYYYFDDQEDLVFQCYEHSCQTMAQRLQVALDLKAPAMATIEAFVDGMLHEESDEFAALSEVAFLRPEQRETILAGYGAVLGSIAELLATGAERGELRQCESRIAAQAVVGLVSWIPLARRWRTSDPLSHGEIVTAIKELLRLGVAADRTAPVNYRPLEISPRLIAAARVFDTEIMAAARQEALLAAASWLFNLKGTDATSLEEIASRLGVTKKVVYHNVGDKETVVAECYRRSFDIYNNLAEQMLTYDGPLIDAITAAAHANAEVSMREEISPLATLAGFEALSEGRRAENQEAAARLMATYLAVYTRGQAEGVVRSVNTRAVIAVLPALHQWLPKWFDILTPEERQAAPTELGTLLRLGLLPT